MESAGSNVLDVRRENFVSPFGDSIIVMWDNPPVSYHPKPEDQGIGSVPDDVVLDLLADRNRLGEIRNLKRQLEDTKAEYKAYKRTTWEKLRRILSFTSEVTDVTWAAIGTRVEIIRGPGEASRAARELGQETSKGKGLPNKKGKEKDDDESDEIRVIYI
ncbi:hypothetical protein Salat_1700800 [Sesamum alatum]|uniref:Uncharacterized protein n=1 Tax=Sesamum alatum TaxID=300844 RepID=A0AAE1Y8C6_9LAMI|nr:hypothetical protein Salat_1700800 [Sesamum alatum]